MPADALFSGPTAGWLHGLDLEGFDPIEVTLPQKSACSHLAGVLVRRSDYFCAEACDVRGLRVTSSTRTTADLARRGPLVESVVVLDMALRRGVVQVSDLDRWADEHPRHRGLGVLRHGLRLADPASESPMETRLRVVLVSGGLPMPVVQPTLREAGGFIARPDLCYPEARIAIEYDGLTHRTSVAADDRRQNRLTDAGYRVLRFTASDVVHNPASVVAQVRRALGYSIGSPN